MFQNSKPFSSFSVNDIAEARRFYSDVLDIKVVDGPMGTLQLEIGAESQVLVYPKEDHAPASFTVLNYTVSDIDAAVDELKGRGVSMQQYEGFGQDDKGVLRSEGEDPTIAWFTDPSGNVISVMQV